MDNIKYLMERKLRVYNCLLDKEIDISTSFTVVKADRVAAHKLLNLLGGFSKCLTNCSSCKGIIINQVLILLNV